MDYSDLDLYFVTTDEAYEDFVTDKARFAHQLGRLLFLEDFGEVHGSLFVHENGTEGEFCFGRQSDFQAICSGPYTVLFDRLDLLEGGEFPAPAADHERQLEVLRRQIDWFWHELSHFIKAMGRRQWWFAYGQVEAMRRMCVMLARLDHDFTDTAAVESEPYFKIGVAAGGRPATFPKHVLRGRTGGAASSGQNPVRVLSGCGPRLGEGPRHRLFGRA